MIKERKSPIQKTMEEQIKNLFADYFKINPFWVDCNLVQKIVDKVLSVYDTFEKKEGKNDETDKG